MSLISSFNSGSSIDWGVDTSAYGYVGLKALYDEHGAGHVFPLIGVFVNPHTKYGEQPVAIIPGTFVNLPKHLLDTVKAIREDPETVNQIKSLRAGFYIREYEDTKNGSGTQYTVSFTDINPGDIQ